MACWAEHISYAPQQLNFTVWCATTGCGISREVLDKVQEQTKSFLMIYVYFTVKGYFLEWIDFRVDRFFLVTQFSAVLKIIIMTSHHSNKDVRNLEFHQAQTSASKEVIITVLDLFSLMWQMFLSQQLHSNILVIISAAMRVEKPSKAIWFISYGMTMQKLTFLWQTRFDASWDDRLNQSIEAFIYCILGSHVNVRLSILGSLGSAKEAQRDFSYWLRMPSESQTFPRVNQARDLWG